MIFTIYPDRWVLCKTLIQEKDETHTLYRVLASWNGCHLNSDSWRLSSGFTDDDAVVSLNNEGYFVVHQESGNSYVLNPMCWGLTEYAKTKLDAFVAKPEISRDHCVAFEVLTDTLALDKLAQLIQASSIVHVDI